MRQVLPTIVVIGFMGAGKTSVGRLVARALGREFVDTDRLNVEQVAVEVLEWYRRRVGAMAGR